MSKLMSVLGIVLLAIGVALALVGFVNPAQMQVYGLTMDTAAILLSGGVLSVGLGGVISALPGHVATSAIVTDTVPVIEEARAVTSKFETNAAEVVVAAAEEAPARIRFNGFGRKAAVVATTAAAATVAAADTANDAKSITSGTSKSTVDDTIAALEQAKADIANAIGGVSTLTETKVEGVVDDVEDDEAEVEAGADGELYVLEERDIRGRPARILSDNTVEAETDEGWMRFENLEHLNEYLDAAGEPA
jgi:hypothetical protein